MNSRPTTPQEKQKRSIEAAFEAEAARAGAMMSFFDSLTRPTPAIVWLDQAAQQIERRRDPDGSKRARTDKLKIEVMERDGNACWFCAKPLNGDVSLEHLQPLALGGSWDTGNLALAHVGCNKAAGHLPRFKKEILREEMRDAQPGVSP